MGYVHTNPKAHHDQNRRSDRYHRIHRQADCLDLLEAGHRVRGSLRSMARADEVRDTLRRHLNDPAALNRLDFVELDLMRDDGWEDALKGADALVHTASPFPIAQPKDPQDVVRPAVDGTLRALRAATAAGVTRVVLTSSIVAMMQSAAARSRPVTEADWSDPDDPTMTPYGLSKTQAERAAWAYVADHPATQLVVINPGLVVGEPLDEHYGTSLRLIERLFGGKDPMVPDIALAVVDLDDVSRLHVQGVSNDAMVGHRHLAAAAMVGMPHLARVLADAYPGRKIATRIAPAFLLRLLALFDPVLKSIVPQLGIRYKLDNSATRQRTGIAFVPVDTAVLKTAAWLANR